MRYLIIERNYTNRKLQDFNSCVIYGDSKKRSLHKVKETPPVDTIVYLMESNRCYMIKGVVVALLEIGLVRVKSGRNHFNMISSEIFIEGVK